MQKPSSCNAAIELAYGIWYARFIREIDLCCSMWGIRPEYAVRQALGSFPMSSTIMQRNRFSLIAAVILLANTFGDVLSAAYSRADDIEPFGL